MSCLRYRLPTRRSESRAAVPTALHGKASWSSSSPPSCRSIRSRSPTGIPRPLYWTCGCRQEPMCGLWPATWVGRSGVAATWQRCGGHRSGRSRWTWGIPPPISNRHRGPALRRRSSVSPLAALGWLPVRRLDGSETEDVSHGRSVPEGALERPLPGAFPATDTSSWPVALASGEALVAVAELEAGMLKPTKVLHAA